MNISNEAVVYKVIYPFCGIGGGAIGFQKAQQEWKGIKGRFETLVGIDADPGACENFEKLTGAPAVCLDLFERRDYIAFHGKEPPAGWKEATPEDIRKATKGVSPDVVFSSPPCKGFSGLLPEASAKSDKYQALNRLTERGIFLILEAFSNDLPGLILIENVPRIRTRGAKLLHTIKGMLQSYGYVICKSEDEIHDCGEVGGLAQHRRRYLLIARNPQKITSFVYKPPVQRVKAIGEVIGPMPMPDDPAAGPMHKLPRLQFKTWVRLALIPAGGDWRDLENINPEQYRLEHVPRKDAYGVQGWEKPGKTVIGNARVGGSQASAISDPRLKPRKDRHASVYQVVKFDEPGPCVTGTRFGSGAPAISDPRTGFKDGTHGAIYKVSAWDETANTVTGAHRPNNGAICTSDPRLDHQQGRYSNKFQMLDWEKAAGTVIGTPDIQSGAPSINDPRLSCKPRSGMMGVQDWNEPGKTVIGSGDIHAGATAIADPRVPADNESGTWIIISLDGTWHRPLTTLELAALQSIPLTMPDGSPLKLVGKSDAKWREWIGNVVPPDAAQAVAETMLLALLQSINKEWVMSLNGTDIWVKSDREIDTIISNYIGQKY